MANPKASQPESTKPQGKVTIHAKADIQGKAATLELQWREPKKRSYFNTFDLDPASEKGFVICRFAFVRWGDCVDCTTVLIPEPLIQASRENFFAYMKEVGLSAVDYDSKTPEIPHFNQGTLEFADIVNVSRSGDVGEIALHAFSVGCMKRLRLA
jgi:hypothetical protein